MQALFNTTKKILSYRWMTLAIVFISISIRCIQLIFFFNIRVDRSYQLLATQNFVYGKGISTSEVLPGDLSKIIYTPLIKWPPGYSILLAPFYSALGNNYLLSALLLDIIFAVILIFVTRAILKLLDIQLFLINLYTFITSLFIYYFYFITSSDAIATTFFIMALYYTLLFLKMKLNLPKAVALITLFLFICAFMKYLFMPVVFIIPLFLSLKGLLDKNRLVLKVGILCLLILSTCLIILLLYQKSISGHSAYISDAENGFFPSNLFSAYPLIPGSLIKPDTIGILLNNPGAEADIITYFQWIYLLVIIASILSIPWLLNKYSFRKIKLKTIFFYLTIGVCLVTTLLLSFLSIRVAKAEDTPGNWWTFIQEPRYYGLPNILIHLCIFIFVQSYFFRKRQFLKYFCFAIFLLLLPETFRGIIFTAKRVRNAGKEQYSWQYDLKFQKYADEIIKKERKNNEQIVITGSVYYMINRISLYSKVPPLNAVEEINSLSLLNSKKTILLLAIIHKTHLAAFKPFLSEKKNQAIGHFEGYNFYTIRISPH